MNTCFAVSSRTEQSNRRGPTHAHTTHARTKAPLHFLLTVSSDEQRLPHRCLPRFCPSRFARNESDHFIAVSARRDFRIRNDYSFVRQVHGVSSACKCSPMDQRGPCQAGGREGRRVEYGSRFATCQICAGETSMVHGCWRGRNAYAQKQNTGETKR